MFSFYSHFIRIERTVYGTQLAICQDEDFDPQDTIYWQTTSRDPLSMAWMLRDDLNLRAQSELEELAGLLDAHR
jgi:hypothetical protein